VKLFFAGYFQTQAWHCWLVKMTVGLKATGQLYLLGKAGIQDSLLDEKRNVRGGWTH
jgi:hypothetical protein